MSLAKSIKKAAWFLEKDGEVFQEIDRRSLISIEKMAISFANFPDRGFTDNLMLMSYGQSVSFRIPFSIDMNALWAKNLLIHNS